MKRYRGKGEGEVVEEICRKAGEKYSFGQNTEE